MDYYNEYQKKLTTPEEAVKVIRSGDWVDYGGNLGNPILLDRALAARKDELTDVKVRGHLNTGPLCIAEEDPEREHFCYNSWHMLAYERKLCDRGLCNFLPMVYRNLPSYYRRYLTVDVAMMRVTPMNEYGYFNFSINNACARAVMDVAKHIILEVDENLPWCPGFENTIHISEVDAVVEGPHDPLFQLFPGKASEEDTLIANRIVEQIPNGAVIQLGVGGMPDLVGKKIAESDLKDLGVHTELLVNAYLEMQKAGKLTNKGKPGWMKGRGVYSIAEGVQELYDWCGTDPTLMVFPMDYVNDPRVIRELANFTSINSCISVDLYGQVASEAAGTRHISGTGGQLDFLTGAYDNPTGKSFICLKSSRVDKQGVRHSNIRPTMNADIVTDPRSQTQYIVTEYGMENLAGRSTWERAEKLIGLAHPDFREELIAEAEKLGIWRRTNRR
ncbi:MAG: butyryl-CoA:acetate CoA-transferase [Mogibacterium sp.]|nr:butyryl-CoA:acetate CoA-transferase [Mogibacterium sp.]